MNVSPIPAPSTAAPALIPPAASKTAKLSALARKLAAATPDNQARAGGAAPRRQGHKEQEAQEVRTTQGGRGLAGLGRQQSNQVRAPARRAPGRSDLIALARFLPHVQKPPVLKGVPSSRVVGDSEYAELCSLTGVSPTTLAKNATLVIHAPAANAVIPSEDMTTVTPEVGHSFPHHEDSYTHNADGTITIESSELLQSITIPPAIGGATTSVPVGGVLAMVLANPRFIDGTRVGVFLAQFDQYCLEGVEFHYVPGATFTQAGQIEMAYINDVSDPIIGENGLTIMRDAFVRPGSALFSVLKPAKVGLGRPLMKWYYTGSPNGGPFEMPGYIVLINQLAVSNATASSIPLGSLIARFRIRVRSPTLRAGVGLTYYSQSENCVMTNAVTNVNVAITVTVANTTMSGSATYGNAIYWAIIAAVDDTGPGNSNWRTWTNPFDNSVKTIAAGDLLIYRVAPMTSNINFFPTVGAALASVASGSVNGLAYFGAATQAAGTLKGFKLWNITGTDASGYNVV